MSDVEFQTGFNVRSYGVLVAAAPNRDPHLLLSRERIQGLDLVKFPGGGIEFKEGPGPAVAREFAEELGLGVAVEEIFYVSPRFHRSYFRPQQFIGLYWRVKPLQVIDWARPFPEIVEGDRRQQGFWQPLRTLAEDLFVHPLDREVAVAIRTRPWP